MKKIIFSLLLISNLSKSAEFMDFQFENQEQDKIIIDSSELKELKKYLFEDEIQENSDNVEKKFLCDECNNGYCFSSKSALNKHKRDMHLNQQMQCKECNSILKNKTVFQAHLKLVHSASRFKCDRCHKTFKNVQYLKRHQHYMHTFRSEESFSCSNEKDLDYNGEISFQNLSQFLTIKKLEEEIVFKNNNESDDLDPSQNQDQVNLSLPEKNEEYKTFDLNNNKPFCNECKKFYATNYSLNKHIKDVHKAVSCQCKECGKEFRNEDGLNRHTNRVHTMKNCDICNQLFKDDEDLKNHQLKIHYMCRCHKKIFLTVQDAFSCEISTKILSFALDK